MLKRILLVILVLLVFMPRCDQIWNECYWDDRDCDDSDPCTKDACEMSYNPYGASERVQSCQSNYRGYCKYSDVADGTPCEVDEQTGVCGSGECRLEGETADGAFEVQPQELAAP